MAPKDARTILNEDYGDEWPPFAGWMFDTKTEKTRPAVNRVEVQKPLLDGSPVAVSIWSYFGDRQHRVTGEGRTIARAQIDAAQKMEREFTKWRETIEPWYRA